MDAEQFQNLFRVGEKARRHEHQSERYLRGAELRAQRFRPLAQSGFIEVGLPVRADGMFVAHVANLAARRAFANQVRRGFFRRPRQPESGLPQRGAHCGQIRQGPGLNE